MSGHTPGPWHTSGDRGYGEFDGDRILDDRGYVLAVAIGDVPELAPVANARLIAAAPELLSIAERWAAIDGGAWHPERYMASLRELKADTAAAIAKATGESA